MAEKRSKSILSGLTKMLHREPGKPSEPARKSSGSSRKKTAAPVAEKRPPAAPPADAPADQPSAAEAKPEKKPVQPQPWYRHRQRW